MSSGSTIVESVDPIPKAPAEREATMVEPDDTDGMNDVLEELEPYAAD